MVTSCKNCMKNLRKSLARNTKILCQNGHIPSNNHREFYRSLQHEKIRDALPEPNKEESDVETDRNNDEEQ